jgi:uncharacterized protein YjbI with pentapeptide repeats
MSWSSRFFSGLILSILFCFGAWAENSDHVQQVWDTGSCPSCDLSSSYLKGLRAASGDLSNASLQSANLRDANLEEASFAGADLTGAELLGANLYAADLSGANLAGVTTDATTTCPDGSPGPCIFLNP